MSAATAEKIAENSAGEDVPTRLIQTAIALYGERGCHAVSAREIIREAGVLNEAAVRYYFGSKQDLLEACLQSIAAEIQPIMTRRWTGLAERKEQKSIAVSDVVTAMFIGLIELQFQHDSALQLLARMIREEGSLGQDLLLKTMSSDIWRFEQELADVLPEKSAKAMRLHSLLAFNSMVNGLVDQGLLNRLPATELGSDFYQLKADELLHGFVAYVSAGISCSVDL